MERRSSSFLAGALFALAATGLARAQEPQPIGEHGARIVLAKGWKRTRFAKNVEAEQLVGVSSRGLLGSTKAYAMVRECLGLFECDRDYRLAFAGLEELPEGAAITVEDEGARRRVVKVVDHTIDKTKFTFRSELLVVDGYAMHVMCWVESSDRGRLAAMVDDLVDGIELPRGDKQPGGGLQPERQKIVRGTVELSLALRPYVLRPLESEDSVRSWQTVDERQGLVVYEVEGMPNAAAAIDKEIGIQRSHDTQYREVERTPRRIGDVECVEFRGASSQWSYRGLVVPAGSGRWLVLRHWASGSLDDPRADRDAIFASLQLQPSSAASLPPLAEPVAVGELPPESMRALFEASRRRAGHPGWVREWVPGPKGVWFTLDQSGVHRHVGDEEPRLMLTSQPGVRSMAPWGDMLVAIVGEQVQLVAADGKATPAPFAAEQVAAVGDGLLCVRRPRAQVPLSPGSASARSELWLRANDGKERLVRTLEGWVADVQADRDAKRLLVVVTDEEANCETHEIDLGSGESRARTRWFQAPDLGPAANGWLATGTPEGRPYGVWHLQSAAGLRLLVGGDLVTGVMIDEGELWYARQRGQEGQLASVPLAAAEQAAAKFRFVSADDLSSLGDALLAKVGSAPRHREDVLAALAALQELARQRLGGPFATSVVEIDQMVANAHAAATVGPSSRIVLALLMAGCALERGAEWVASPTPSWLQWVVAGRGDTDNVFAVARHVPSALTAALDDSEADLQQAGRFAIDAEGRRFLCGVDAQALAAAAAAAVPAEFRAADASSAAQTTALVRRWPQNVALRRHAYSRLAAANAWSELAELAGEAVAKKERGPDHVVAWLCARERLLANGAADAELERDVLAAIAEHGRDVRLWLLLGGCSERQTPAATERARACYERALELRPYGELYASANAALERLDAKPK